MEKIFRETFKIQGSNVVAITHSGMVLVIQDIKNAEKNNNLPHQTLIIANQSSVCTLYIFLDSWSDLTKPDYVLFPSQQMTIPIEDGQAFTQVAIYNTHAVTDVAIGELKYKISTLKRF